MQKNKHSIADKILLKTGLLYIPSGETQSKNCILFLKHTKLLQNLVKI